MSLSFIKSIAHNDPSGYYAWQIKQAKSVKIQSYHIDAKLERIVRNIIKDHPPVMKGCYDIAIHLALSSDNIIYVEGKTASLIPLDHAWNVYRSGDVEIYFDLIAEIVWLQPDKFTDYQAIIELSSCELINNMDNFDTYGTYLISKYKEYQNETTKTICKNEI